MSDAPRLPVKIDSTSNGEFAPVAVPSFVTEAKRLARDRLADAAKRVNVSRRAFFAGLCGTAGTFLALNEAFAAVGKTGGYFDVDAEEAFDLAAAGTRRAKREFIFDVQTHMVNPAGEWRANHGKYWEQILSSWPQGRCGAADPVDCYNADRLIEDVFVDSDTDAAVLSFVPETPLGNPLDLKEADRTRQLVAQLGDGRHRLLLHAMVIPNMPDRQAELDRMTRVAADWEIAAWKVYTQWGPEGRGWRFDDPEVGIPFVEHARALGIDKICVHKGLSFPGMPTEFSNCADIGAIAALYPDMKFLVYHSGFEADRPERAFDPDDAARGVDSLVKSLLDHGVAPNSNLYAELGSTWRFALRDPDTAAHTLGKLIQHVGENNVLWGTDSIWYGSPQDQIQAFRSFQISDALIDAHGYAPLSASLKEKVFGLNGAAIYGLDPAEHRRKAENDLVAKRRRAKLEMNGLPHLETFGPRTRAEYEAFLKSRAGAPA